MTDRHPHDKAGKLSAGSVRRRPLSMRRIADAEYALDAVGARVERTPFGTFVHDPLHLDRANATQLVHTRVAGDQVEALLADLDVRYRQLGLRHRLLAGFDPDSFAALAPALRRRGFAYEIYWALVKQFATDRSGHPALELRLLEPGSGDAISVHLACGRDLPGVQLAAAKARALGGRELVAYLRDEPVGVAGYYRYRGVVRFTLIGTVPAFRKLGVATSLISAMAALPELRELPLVICADEQGPISLYERLGFVRYGFLWNFFRS